MRAVEIVTYSPELAPEFDRINRAWIETLFRIEPADEAVLRAPDQILAGGGTILFARVGARVVGTVALVRLGPDEFEIAKMGVDPDQRGQGIGDALMAAIIDEARRRGARRLKIETNSRLAAALRLYRRYGFVDQPVAGSAHGFARADVFLERSLEPPPSRCHTARSW